MVAPVEPAARVRAIIAAAGAMDIESIEPWLARDVVMELPYAPEPLRRVHTGKDAVVDFQRRARESFSSFSMELDTLLVDGARVVVEHHSEGTASTTGRVYRNRYVTVFEFDSNGLVCLWREYYDPDAVRRAFFAD